MGLGISALILLGKIAAQIAVSSIRKKWDGMHKLRASELPGLTGGGSTSAHFLGFAAPVVMPLAFIAAWLWILAKRVNNLP